MENFDFNLSGVTPDSVRRHIGNHASGIKLDDAEKLNQAIADITSICHAHGQEAMAGRSRN